MIPGKPPKIMIQNLLKVGSSSWPNFKGTERKCHNLLPSFFPQRPVGVQIASVTFCCPFVSEKGRQKVAKLFLSCKRMPKRHQKDGKRSATFFGRQKVPKQKIQQKFVALDLLLYVLTFTCLLPYESKKHKITYPRRWLLMAVKCYQNPWPHTKCYYVKVQKVILETLKNCPKWHRVL